MSQFPTSFLPSLYAAWRWWSGEIAALVPASLRHRLTQRRGRLMLIMGAAGAASIVHENGDRQEALGDLDLTPARLAASREILAAIRTRMGRSTAGIAVRLPAEAALRTVLTLPLAAQANLPQVVSFELDRRTPFRSDEVYWTQRLLKRDTTAQRLTIELTAVPRTAVDNALALARGLGIDPDTVEVANARLATEPSGNLLPAGRPTLATRLPRLVLGGLAAATALAMGAALLIPLYQAHQTLEALAIEMAEAKRQAEESTRLQKEIDAVVQEGGFLGRLKSQTPSASEILQAVTNALPDDTWLTDLHISSSEVKLNGYSTSASTLLGLLDQSPPFADATFRSPVTQNAKTGVEQFDISVRITRPGGL